MKKRPFLYIFTGAGCSAPSGTGTFRDSGGMWDKYDPMVVCNMATYKENYELHHEFYNLRRVNNGLCKPNAAHYQIAAWKEKYRARVKVVTTNIDDLLERAGCDDVQHLHGLVTEMIFKAGTSDECIESVGNTSFDAVEYQNRTGYRCRANVRLFNESVYAYEGLHAMFQSIEPDDLVLVVGCSNVVVPFHQMASSTFAYSIEINKEPKGDYWFSRSIERCASEALPDLDGMITKFMDKEH